uniref:G2 and S phase-expressed protein 1 n=1 Tax=Geotrypetes seraphini TaxID=260995 RepID=A0A6P8SB26_GEOSA|nr:G2 and S phase-expressed protein 1 [Geotrypetes seraphini]XP_033815343.1 G2 and S phase-expressed protein 1 [Geotrypetes seraphini]XP_033815344.1 G2 and S phase-expressed protein 1 [Geotrypetes seraphini]
MDVQSASGFSLLMDEKFDFDLSLSPKSEKEEDDEVFIGPVGHKERCVAVGIDIQIPDAEETHSLKPSAQGAWSPLSGDKFVEIFKEAHLLALQLSSNRSNEQSKTDKSCMQNSSVEEFVQESKAKLKLFQLYKENMDWCTPSKRETYCVPNEPTPNKRETYCVADSPFSLLPPSVQQSLKIDAPRSTRSPAQVQRTPKNASPLVQKQKTSNSQSKSISEKRRVSKLQHTKAAPIQGNSQRLVKPNPEIKISAQRQRHLSGMGSYEDLCSEKSGIVSDMSDSSFNSKRALPAPHKLGLNTQLKPPSANGPTRKNTTSSSSSSSSFSSINSSMNSSLSVSPVEGNAKPSSTLNASFISCKLPSNTSRLGMVRHNVRSSSLQSDYSKSNQLGKPPKTHLSNAVKAIKSASTSLLQTETPVDKLQRQSSVTGLQRLSIHSKPESAWKENACSKPRASVVPARNDLLKAPKQAGAPSPENALPKVMQPDKSFSCSSPVSGNVASTPVRPSTHRETQTPSLSAKSILKLSARRASALPTPVSRRVSGIPATTPKCLPIAWSSPQLALPCQASSMSTQKLVASSAQTQETKSQVASSQALSSDGEVSPPLLEPFTLDFSPETKVKSEIQEAVKASQSDEILLIDFVADEKPALTVETENKPLIDFTNTPEVHLNAPWKPIIGQLIDLSSPLINLSPDKENIKMDSPLLKF